MKGQRPHLGLANKDTGTRSLQWPPSQGSKEMHIRPTGKESTSLNHACKPFMLHQSHERHRLNHTEGPRLHAGQTHRTEGCAGRWPSATVNLSVLYCDTGCCYKTGASQQMENISYPQQPKHGNTQTHAYIKAGNRLWKFLLRKTQLPLSNMFRHRTQLNKCFALFSSLPLGITTLAIQSRFSCKSPT